ncbi:hypothetical protein BKI52_27070 [marine bacterium AO1-C]|nr:hypothetical protein BKI52_27070 [marine bacterium AO1-C]
MKKILETDRCYLREFVEADVELMHQLNTDPEVMKYLTGGKPLPYEDSKKAVLHYIDKYYAANPGLGMWATMLKEGDQFIGWTCLKHMDKSEHIELGYRYMKEFWGQGYATEVSSALIKYGFEQVNLEAIVGIAVTENTKSTHILQKVGLQYQKKAYYYQTDVDFFQLTKQAYTNSLS